MAFNNVPVNGWPQLKGLGGEGGTSDYSELSNKPSINSVTLSGNKSLADLGITADNIAYDNTESGLIADSVQGAIDEVVDIIPDAVTGNPEGSATAGNLTKLQIGSNIYNVPSGGSGNISYTETEVIPLSSITWAASGSGMYYGYITNVVPVGYKIVSAIIINWDAIRSTDNFILYTPETSPRNIGIMSPNNVFADASSTIKLRVAYMPAT